MNKIKTYKDLLFWQSAFLVSKMCIDLIRHLPRETVTSVIANQLIRSSASVGANISEGYGRFGKKEYPRFLTVSLGSANETEYWLMLLKEAFPEKNSTIDAIIDKNRESIKMLVSSINTLRKK